MLRPLVGLHRSIVTFGAVRGRRLLLRPNPAALRRLESTVSEAIKDGPEGLPDEPPPIDAGGRKEAWIYISAVFPIRLAIWDIRHIIAAMEKEDLLDRITKLLSDTHPHGFKLLSLEPTPKDGGVFVRFQYDSSTVPSPAGRPSLSDFRILREIETSLQDSVDKQGGLPTWKGYGKGQFWLVRGKPWREDLNRFPSPNVRVEFDGPDVDQESLYDMLRPYGRIRDLTQPTPVPAGTLRSSVVNFANIRSATTARNCLHGISIAPHAHDAGAISVAPDGKLTRLRLVYERQIKEHFIWNWLSSHPRIVLPAAAFLLATLTYTIFDPVRAFFVEAKVLDWLDYRQYTVFQWLRRNTIELSERLSFDVGKKDGASTTPVSTAWREREDAAVAMKAFLSEQPSNFALVTGPEGSGKTVMITRTLQGERHSLIIDCAELCKAASDAALVSAVAEQTGYWPVFSTLASLNNMLDLASVGLIGQKAGFSTSIEQQLKQVLEVVSKGLQSVSTRYKQEIKNRAHKAELEENVKAQESVRSELIKRGAWHDGRIDCVAGNGIMSELGVGDELLRESDWSPLVGGQAVAVVGEPEHPVEAAKEVAQVDKDDVSSLPVVVIKNWAMKGAKKDALWTVLSDWAASLVENRVAHVVFASDNLSANKSLAKALPSKPITTIVLEDADTASALAFVSEKLSEAGYQESLTADQRARVSKLGGRLTDLESFVYKVRNGQTVEDAVEEIISRNVAELRKNAFGDDAEDAKSLQWSPEQAWGIFRRLAKEQEIQYADVLLEYPFKGNETALRALEQDEFISISMQNGRPHTIRAGKPVYYSVFERLTNDPVFRAMQDITYNDKAISGAESAIKAAEAELNTLTSIGINTGKSWIGTNGLASRADYLLKKIQDNEKKLEALETQNDHLKQVLKEGS